MLTKFNKNNQGYKRGYPLFLGEDLGIIDTVNETYPQLTRLYDRQQAQQWNHREVSLQADKLDMRTLPADTVSCMRKTILWQSLADSVVSRSIVNTLGRYITNPEFVNMTNIQQYFETIHAISYSYIIQQTIDNPNKLLEELYNDTEVIRRSEIIVKTFDDMEAMDLERDGKLAVQKQIIKTIAALFALEAIAFLGSFAVTFGITETGAFQGIGTIVELICRDELLHTEMDFAILEILKDDPEWAQIIRDTKLDVKEILDDVVQQELNWADYLFSEGRQVVGLNAVLLKEYTLYMARPLYSALNISYDFDVVTVNPLPYMDKHIDPKKIQAASQEIQNKSYNIGSIEDDTDGLDLDFDF